MGVKDACRDGHFYIARYLHAKNGSVDNKSLFGIACENGHFEIAQWLHSLGITISKEEYIFYFEEACNSGKLKLVKWIYSINKACMSEKNAQGAFNVAIRSGNLKLLKWMCTSKHVHVGYEQFAMATGIQGRMHVVEWIYECKEFRILDHVNNLMELGCRENNAELIKWLCTLNEIVETRSVYQKLKAKIQSEHFAEACETGDFEVAELFYRLGFISPKAVGNSAFVNACQEDQIEKMQWLYTLGHVNISKIYKKVLRIAGENGNDETVEWLKSLKVPTK